ncbi:hypothetical protein WJX74_009021 [Apatococcus lobatus]|uniref:serine O-acetyltransferase n=1 Tax=Apatococcus lobatus TaxID=904363 RepID=A0AAW1S6C0_9CHLO
MSQTLVPNGLPIGSAKRPGRLHHPGPSFGRRSFQLSQDKQLSRWLQASSSSAPLGNQDDDETRRINENWQQSAFPTYLQNGTDDFCQAWEEALQAEERRQSQHAHHGVGKKASAVTRENPVWRAMRSETRKEAAKEPLLSSFLYASILSHDTFARSLAFVLANRLSDATMLATELFELFHTLLRDNEEVEQAALADVIAVRERDPACCMYSSALLFYKGYHALQTHRIAHTLWLRNQKVMARTLQSRVSEVCAIDIHPAARIGKGILLDHGTGVVIGETAVIGENVSIMQNVTLGGTGKAGGDRHPKIHNNVLIGASATVLGNIIVGKGAQVAAGSMVLKDVPPRTMVAGSPAKVVGCVQGNAAEQMQHCPSMASIDIPAGHDGPFCETWDSALQSQSSNGTSSDVSPSPPTVEASRPTPSPPIPQQSAAEPTQDEPAAAPTLQQRPAAASTANGPAAASTQNGSDSAVVSEQPPAASLSDAEQSSATLATILFTEQMLRDGLPSSREVRTVHDSGSAPSTPTQKTPPEQQNSLVDIGPPSHIASSSGGLDVNKSAPPSVPAARSPSLPSSTGLAHSTPQLKPKAGPRQDQPPVPAPSLSSPAAKSSKPYKHDPPGRPPSPDNFKPDPERRTRPALVPPSSQSRVNGVPVNGSPVNGNSSPGMRPLNRVGLAASASETARKLAPKQSEQAEGDAYQQQQKLSDDARARLARMSCIASSAQEGTWVDASSSPATQAASLDAAAPTSAPSSPASNAKGSSLDNEASGALPDKAPAQGGESSSSAGSSSSNASSSSRKPTRKQRDPNELLDYSI